MKRVWILSLIVLFISSELYTQEREVKVKVYKTWVTTIDGAKIKGYLHSADAEGIMVNPGKDILSQDLIAIEPQEISKIKVRRKGQVLIGAGVGLAVGAAVGGLLVQEERSSSGWRIPELEAIAVGSSAAIGAGLGAIAGTGRRSFDINGSLETYAAQLPLLQKYSYLVE